MLSPNTRYTAREILDEADVDYTDPSFYQKQIMIGGIQVSTMYDIFNVGSAENVMVTIGNKTIKVDVSQE